jgi:hypothetical protein
MMTRLPLAIAFVLTGLLLPLAGDAAPQAPATFTPLFNGKDLAGWKAEPGGGWRVADGALVYAGPSHARLTSDREIGDYELKAEFQTESGAGPSLALRGVALLNLGQKTPGRWSTLSIVEVGERVTLTIDGVSQMVHQRMPGTGPANKPLPRTGHLSLSAVGATRWRGIEVREIAGAEANAILARHGSEGFTSVFNGKTFDGWAGPIDNYQIVDGAILCKPDNGGTIYTKQEYGDFMVRVEIKLPPGGNNGLAIRYPGEGDTAYVGMTELQVLDNTAEKYANLDNRQFHGSAYGMVPAHKGYLRAVGEWNFEEVTVRGSTIIVELNGTRILDADLSTVKEFMANSAHPGKDRTSGHFGFAGHGDPVQFRNVQIKPL